MCVDLYFLAWHINTEETLEFKPEVIEVMEEARRISRDPNVKGYTDVKQMFKEILADGIES